MIGFDRSRASKDFGFMDALPAFVLIGALFFGGDWLGAETQANETRRGAHDRAMAIAIVGTNAAMEIDLSMLEPTDGFVPAPPAIAEGALVADETSDGAQAFDVEMRVTSIDSVEFVRRIEVRVAYATGTGDTRAVSMETTRQDQEAAHARARSEARQPLYFFLQKPLTS